MQLFYEGVDITADVEIVSAVHRDAANGKSDCLDIVLANAANWYRWKPQRDDAMELREAGYTTGRLYLNSIVPEGNRFRILAVGMSSAANRRRYQSYTGRTLGEVMDLCAAECRMDKAVYGLDENYRYPYLLRKNEGCAAFLNRIAEWEGAALKTVSGRFSAIDLLYAQELPASGQIRISVEQSGAIYTRNEAEKVSALTVRTPYAEAVARDSAAEGREERVLTCIPATDSMTAGRWARGILTAMNRKAEEIRLETAYNPVYTALARFDVFGGTDADGEWIADEVEHDFVKKTSSVRFLRVIQTVK